MIRGRILGLRLFFGIFEVWIWVEAWVAISEPLLRGLDVVFALRRPLLVEV